MVSNHTGPPNAVRNRGHLRARNYVSPNLGPQRAPRSSPPLIPARPARAGSNGGKTSPTDPSLNRNAASELESFTLDGDGGAELCDAAASGDESAVRDLLRAGDVNLLLWRTPGTGRSALHHAAVEGHGDVVRALIKSAAMAVVNLQDLEGSTALALAALRGFEDVVQILLDAGADADKCRTWGSSPLYLAAKGGHFETVEVLLDHGVELDTQNRGGATALFAACLCGFSRISRLLVRAGANVELARDDIVNLDKESNGRRESIGVANRTLSGSQGLAGMTPLHIAAQQGHATTVGVLVSAGANTLRRGPGGATALYLAAKEGACL